MSFWFRFWFRIRRSDLLCTITHHTFPPNYIFAQISTLNPRPYSHSEPRIQNQNRKQKLNRMLMFTPVQNVGRPIRLLLVLLPAIVFCVRQRKGSPFRCTRPQRYLYTLKSYYINYQTFE